MGEAIAIEEPNENSFENSLENNIRIRGISNVAYFNKDAEKMNDNGVTGVDFKKIKLRYEVKIIFAVK